MEASMIDCIKCGSLPAELQEYAEKTCRLCGTLHCDACLDEAGYCTPCSERTDFSKEEAIAV